jgi:glucokinase
MSVGDFPRLIGDIGGTNARFGWQTSPNTPPLEVASYACADHTSVLNVIRHYLSCHGKRSPPVCALGIANPVLGDRVQMTNHHWSFSIFELQRALGLQRLVVINDFTALALSLPALGRDELCQIGGGECVPNAPLAVLGPGTGLGVSGLLPTTPGIYVPINGEGGHASLAACDDREAAIIDFLQLKFGHASAERALSGPGLVNLYEAASRLSGHTLQALRPSDIIAGAKSGTDPDCVTALDLFCSFLGGVAGNLALTLGARGGVYIGGGIAPRLIAELQRSSFRERFENKGRFRDYLGSIPTFVISSSISPALIGTGRALDAMVSLV